MQTIEAQAMSPDFLSCWQAAGMHIDAQVRGGIQSWIKALPHPPFLEHLSFRLGNQLFFVRVEDADQRVKAPGSLHGLLTVAGGCQGYACRMPMHRKWLGGWVPVHRGWGLLDALTGQAIHPVDLLTEHKIEMTDWERQDLAVQAVRSYLENQGYRLLSWQGNPAVDPAVWFVGDSGHPEWVVVRTCDDLAPFGATRPSRWNEIAERVALQCATEARGHFASVLLTPPRQPDRAPDAPPRPLWRGHPVQAHFDGLQTVSATHA